MCHHILEGSVLDHSTISRLVEMTAILLSVTDPAHLLFTGSQLAFFAILHASFDANVFSGCKCVSVRVTQHQK